MPRSASVSRVVSNLEPDRIRYRSHLAQCPSPPKADSNRDVPALATIPPRNAQRRVPRLSMPAMLVAALAAWPLATITLSAISSLVPVLAAALCAAVVVTVALLAETARLHAVIARSDALLQRERLLLAQAEAAMRENGRRCRQLQIEVAHANRVAAIGQLSASIGHEINQPLSGVITNAETASLWLKAERPNVGEARAALARIVRDGKRIMELISRIRVLIKKAPPQKDKVDINEAILDVVDLTRGEAVKNEVLVQTQLEDELPLICGDRVQLQQVIINLTMNAVEAMSALKTGPREVLISTARAGASDGIVVAVRDSGPGVNQYDLEHIFNAFYTTKVNGLGMGLSICRSIAEAHGGKLWAAANTPQGAVFQFMLPAAGIDEPRPLEAPRAH